MTTSRVDERGHYSNRSNRITRSGLLDFLIRCHEELKDLAALLRQPDDSNTRDRYLPADRSVVVTQP
jgi:hypothetical protein